MTTPDAPDDPNAADPTPDAAAQEEAEDRAAILRRRAVFIASAIAGLGVAGCSSDPRPCLDVYVPPDPTTTGTTTGDPQPCLTTVPTNIPEDLDAGTPSDAGRPPTPSPDAGDGGAPIPGPCLKVAPRPCLSPPRPCLSPKPCLDMPPPGDPDKP